MAQIDSARKHASQINQAPDEYNNLQMKESEWKKFKKLKALCLERFCDDVLNEATHICKSGDKTAHQRYGDLYKLIRDKDKELANAFDGLSRSKAFIQLMMMYSMGLVEEEQLDEFEDGTKNSIRDIVGPDDS